MVKKSSQKTEEIGFDVRTHELVPKHEKLSATKVKELMDKYKVSLHELPKIRVDDPAIKALDLKWGDIVKITRKSQTMGKTVYYRGVVDE